MNNANPWEGLSSELPKSIKDPSASTAPPQRDVAPPFDSRDQLRRRVENRVNALEAALAQLDGKDGNQDRIQGLVTELQLVQDLTYGGWDHVGEMEALQLSQWITNTEPLIGGVTTAPVPKQDGAALQAN
jgi:hypothetical protein